MTLVEVCVDDAAGLAAAIEGGADRIELCSALELGGLTPSPGLIAVAAAADIPVRAMIRPRSGDFVFTPGDVRTMLADIAHVRAVGLAGVVLGASQADGRLDIAVLRDLVAAAAGLQLTLHRAVDLVPDIAEAVEQAVTLGFDTILTSGRAPTAVQGLGDLVLAHATAAGRLTVMAGSGVNAETAGPILRQVPLGALHGSCSVAAPLASEPAARLGFGCGGRKATSVHQVRAFKAMAQTISGALLASH